MGGLNSNLTISGTRVGAILTSDTIEGGPWGAKNSTDDITVDPGTSDSRIEIQLPYVSGKEAMIYIPPGYDNNSDLYKLHVFCMGSGEPGASNFRSLSIGTGNGVQTIFSGNLNNSNRIISGSLIIKVDGSIVAHGRFGIITGADVTGTYNDSDPTSASYSITFSSAPGMGESVTAEMYDNKLMNSGTGRFSIINEGDESNYLEVVGQIPIFPPGQDIIEDWDDLLDYITANYRVDTDQIYVSGLSLGAGFAKTVAANRAASGSSYIPAAYLFCSAGNGEEGSMDWTGDLSKRGKWYHHGSADTTVGFGISGGMASGNANTSALFPTLGTLYWGKNHSGSVWDTEVYNRKNRTDTAGTAKFDFLEDYFALYNLDEEAQADNFVSRAESTEDNQDYRMAVKIVATLSAGAIKTALEGRLSTLKSTIGNWVNIDFGTAFRATTSDPNFNNITSATAGTTVSNLKDESGANTGYAVKIQTATATTPTMVDDLGSTRLQSQAFGFEYYTSRDGMLIDKDGEVRLESLTPSTDYRIKIFHAASNSSFSSRAEIEVTVDGVTKTQYSDLNNAYYLEFDATSDGSGVIPISLGLFSTRSLYLQAISFIEI